MFIQRCIAVLQILGAFFGVAIVITQSTSHEGISFFSFVGLAIYVLIGLAGVGVWRGTPRGLRQGIFAQAVQIPWIATAHFTYRLAAGAGLWFGWGTMVASNHNYMWFRTIGCELNLEYRQGFGAWIDQLPTVFAINVIALAAMCYLIRRLRNPQPQVEDLSETRPAARS